MSLRGVRQLALGVVGWSGLTPGQILYPDSSTTLTSSPNFTWGTAAGQGLFLGAGTATTDQQALSITQTWNNAAVTFTGVKIAITDTASASASKALEILGGAAGTTSLLILDNAGFLKFGGSTSSFPALIRSGATLQLKLANDSGFAQLTAGIVQVQQNVTFFFGSGSVVKAGASGDGILTLVNNASSGFDRLQLGGDTSSFPALKRSSTALQARLADDSGYAPFAAKSYNVDGTDGASFGPGVPVTMTVVNGIITAIA